MIWSGQRVISNNLQSNFHNFIYLLHMEKEAFLHSDTLICKRSALPCLIPTTSSPSSWGQKKWTNLNLVFHESTFFALTAPNRSEAIGCGRYFTSVSLQSAISPCSLDAQTRKLCNTEIGGNAGSHCRNVKHPENWAIGTETSMQRNKRHVVQSGIGTYKISIFKRVPIFSECTVAGHQYGNGKKKYLGVLS